MSSPRDVKPFVDLGVVPFFMDRKLIAAEIIKRQCTRKEAVAILTTLWMKEPGHGHS